MIANLNEMRDRPLSEVPDEYIEAVVDQGIRHRPGARPADFLAAFLKTARQLHGERQDGTWGEAERAVAIIIRRMVTAERAILRMAAERAELQAQHAATLAALEGGP